MQYKDYYAILGVAPDASLEHIKKAYRLLAKTHHPDMSKEVGAEERFKEAAEAYACLKNPEKRAAYDALGKGVEGQGFTPPPEWENQFANGQHDFSGMDLSDLLASLNASSQGRHFSNAPRNGEDTQNSVRISMGDSLNGCSMALHLQSREADKHIEVKIPPGVRVGQKIRLKGMGGQGRHGGRNGDMFLNVELLPHPLFKPHDSDLYFELAVCPWEAVLGADIEIPTLEGNVVLTLPPGTKHGQKLRIKGKGLAAAQHQRGDLYAVVHLETPSSVTDDERGHYQALAATSTFDPRAHLLQETPHAHTVP